MIDSVILHPDNYAIIPHMCDHKALLIAVEDRWTLPQHRYLEASAINHAIKEQFGLDATTLDCIYDRYKDDEREDQHQVYALENHSPDWEPPGNGSWVSREELSTLTLAIPEHRAVLEAWFAEVESGNIPAWRLPWARSGWFASASMWISQQLHYLGIEVTGLIEQIAVRMWSSILRVPTTIGDVYFKAASPAFAFEPLLTHVLSERLPAHSPHVLAVDSERHWMLMEDAGKTLRTVIEAEGNTQRFAAMLPQFAQFQMKTPNFLEELLATNCPDRRLDKIPALFEETIADMPALLIGKENGMSGEEYEQLRSFTPQLREMCSKLASYNIPATLHHDDFHPGNMLVKGENIIFFDWAESAIAHPFYSMTIVIRYAKYVYKYDENALNHLRDVYLQAWTSFEPMERLIEAFQLALRLGILCRALTWHNAVAQLEERAKWPYEGSMPYWLRMFMNLELFFEDEL